MRVLIIFMVAIGCSSLLMKNFLVFSRKGLRDTLKSSVSNDWEKYFSTPRETKYQIIADPSMESMAKEIINKYPDRFFYHPTKWAKFPDG
jgi:hypothetical protein